MVLFGYENAEAVMNIPTSQAEQQMQYHDIVALFDDCDAIAAHIQAQPDNLAEAHFNLLAPLLSDVSEAAEELSAEYMVLLDGPAPARKMAKGRIESGLRKIHLALDAYRERSKHAAKAVAESAEIVVRQLVAHIDRVVAVFLSAVSVSLSRVMHNMQVEEFKRRNRDIAFALHQLSQQSAPQH